MKYIPKILKFYSPKVSKKAYGGYVDDSRYDLIYKPWTRNSMEEFYESEPPYPVEPVSVFRVKPTQTIIKEQPIVKEEQTEEIVEKPIETVKEKPIEKPVSSVSNGKIYKSKEKQQFQADMYSAYYKALRQRNLDDKSASEFAKRLTTQDILESTWGQSSLSKDYNFGGIKDFSGKGVSKNTKEFIEGKMVSTSQPFKRFNSIDDYVNYKINLVNNNWHVLSYDSDKYFSLIVSGKKKYATDPNYTSKLINLHKQVWNGT